MFCNPPPGGFVFALLTGNRGFACVPVAWTKGGIGMDNIWFASKRDGAALHMVTVEELP